MLLPGIDLCTSPVKVSVAHAATRQAIASVSYPETEHGIKLLMIGSTGMAVSLIALGVACGRAIRSNLFIPPRKCPRNKKDFRSYP